MKRPKIQTPEPKKCWVNEGQKVCYDTREEAEGAARLAELQYGQKPNSLTIYKCEYGDHWHLAHQ